MPDTEVILERIERLGEGLREIASTVKEHNERERKFEQEYIKAHAELVNSTNNAHSRIADLKARVEANEKAIDELQKAVQPLIQANKILTWLAILLGSSIIALIWMIITHQVTIVW